MSLCISLVCNELVCSRLVHNNLVYKKSVYNKLVYNKLVCIRLVCTRLMRQRNRYASVGKGLNQAPWRQRSECTSAMNPPALRTGARIGRLTLAC